MRLLREGWLQQNRKAKLMARRSVSHPDYLGQIGLIMPYSKDFCASCNRLRVSSIGKLHLCCLAKKVAYVIYCKMTAKTANYKRAFWKV